MMIDRLFNRLKVAQAEYAIQALSNPGNKTEFDFGYRVGVTAGYESALKMILVLLDEEKKGGDF